MNIILNRQSLQYPLTGIGWYTWHLLHGLHAHELVNQVICIPALKSNENILIPKNLLINPIFNKIIKKIPGSYTIINYCRNKNFKKKTQYRFKDDFIYHEPCYIFRPYLGKKICTVHDLSYIHYPDYHPSQRVKLLTRHLPHSLATADHIITGSDFIRNEIINLFNVSETRITRIYHGVSARFKPRSFFEIKAILEKFGLSKKKYLLSVATLEPRKNLERLILSFKKLSPQQRKQFPLVLVGIKGWKNYKLQRLIGALVQDKHLYYLGYISEKNLPYLYSGAFGFIYLSIYEGFGLPLLEAMASGVPILAANRPCITEIVGDAVLLADPFNIRDIFLNLCQLLYNNKLREQLKQQGINRADKFSWTKCIDDTVNVYKKVAG